MMFLPFVCSYTTIHWRKAIDIMLEKNSGDSKITRLHIIVIVEGDMNSIMKVIWNRHLVPCVEEIDFISPAQFGNKEEKTALDALLLQIVTMDCLCLFCLNRALIINDVIVCYDRMILHLTFSTLQSVGLPKKATECNVHLNQDTQHLVKTYAGISKDVCPHSGSYPKLGEGQGNTLSTTN
eukprot:6244608-Ditylum_brightwellii.AAC.1